MSTHTRSQTQISKSLFFLLMFTPTILLNIHYENRFRSFAKCYDYYFLLFNSVIIAAIYFGFTQNEIEQFFVTIYLFSFFCFVVSHSRSARIC
jgi:hypothetical protein